MHAMQSWLRLEIKGQVLLSSTLHLYHDLYPSLVKQRGAQPNMILEKWAEHCMLDTRPGLSAWQAWPVNDKIGMK